MITDVRKVRRISVRERSAGPGGQGRKACPVVVPKLPFSKVAEPLRAGTTFTGQVFPTRLPTAMPPVPTNTEKGGRDERGRS
jgi:hypothetical protein